MRTHSFSAFALFIRSLIKHSTLSIVDEVEFFGSCKSKMKRGARGSGAVSALILQTEHQKRI